MDTTMGEYAVGAYLMLRLNCDIITYNVRFPERGQYAKGELDVVGLNFKTNTAYLCEVSTHIIRLGIGDYETSVRKIREKHERQQEYAQKYLTHFTTVRCMYWAPRVPKGLVNLLQEIEGLELIFNDQYTKSVEELRERARNTTKKIGNPFFRVLQILEHLKD